MRKLKHIFISAVLVTVCLALTVTAAALRVGDTVDYVLATDIRAFYDGYEMPVYNIGGHVSVVAEDLVGYGFSVTWNGENRTLSIDRISDTVSAPAAAPAASRSPIGTRLMPVLYTDIITFVNGKEVPSFNIDGRTVIHFEALGVYGSFFYDNDARLALISTKGYTFETRTVEALPKEILHAGGALGSYVGTNSLESLNNSHYRGHRFYELDFVLSSDNIPVALHGWSNGFSPELSETPITAEEFSKVKILGLFTSLTLDSLVEWMVMHPDTYIITDVKDDNIAVLRTIAAMYPNMINRFIPQIYQYSEYAHVRAMGYSDIILTLYRLPEYNDKTNSEYNVAFAKKHKLLAVSAPSSLIVDGFEEEYIAAGVPLFVHTVNDPAEKQALYDKGISGVYTDFAG